MQKLVKITSVGTPFPQTNVDTDIIMPSEYLKTIERTGLGIHAFESVRYDAEGKLTGEAVFDRPEYAESEILIAGDNFGCGSSREHAPWAIADLGFRVIIAPSFADIFNSNCFKNGILTVTLPQEQVDVLIADGEILAPITVDLENQTIERGNKENFSFEYNPVQKHMLMNGLDEIGVTLKDTDAITTFEAKQKANQPWLYQE